MNQWQERTLIVLLTATGQPLVDPTGPVRYADFADGVVGPHLSAEVRHPGAVAIESTHGSASAGTHCELVIAASGEVDFQRVTSPAGRFTTLSGGEHKSHESTYQPPGDADPNRQYEADARLRAAVPAAFSCGLNLALAALLLVAAATLVVRRDRPRSVRLFRIYAVAKLPVGFLGALVLAALFSQYVLFGQLAAVPGLVGCLYPVLLLSRMGSRDAEAGLPVPP